MWSTATCPRGRRTTRTPTGRRRTRMSAPTGGSTARSSSPCRTNWTPSGRRELAGAFAERVCGGERLPYTLALHTGAAETPDKPDNPHAHLMFSERGNDGIARSAEQWFKRHNPTAPERGGARKSRAAKAGDWLDTTRQAWEQTANRALAQAGLAERIDGRSLPDRRDAAHREGDLERAAELSLGAERPPRPWAVSEGPGQGVGDGRPGGGRGAADRHRPGRAGRRPSAGGAVGAGDRRDLGRGCRRPMTEFEERLTHEYSTLASQYAQEQKQLSGQVASLGEQVRHLAAQYAEAQKDSAKWRETTRLLAEDHQKMGAHVTQLTAAYEALLSSYNDLTNAYNALGQDLTELFQ